MCQTNTGEATASKHFHVPIEAHSIVVKCQHKHTYIFELKSRLFFYRVYSPSMDHDHLPAKQSEPTCTVQLKLCGAIAKEIKKTEKAELASQRHFFLQDVMYTFLISCSTV